MFRTTVCRYLIIFVALWLYHVDACNRRPQGANGDRSAVDENFQILIDGNPSAYIPGQQYNVSISCADNLKFHSFTLTVENEEEGSHASYDTLGQFEIIDPAETRFSTRCENMVESTNTNVKTRAYVAWIAPTNEKSGCVLIKAAILQHRNVWFMDDGFLTKRLCPEEIDEVNSQTPAINPCCACDEAKYELIMERHWSRNTHAKDFPKDAKRTRLSEIIGASHTFEYRFWEYGSRASPGLQEMGEHGSTQTLEAEIKENIEDGDIRTIIKAPGILYRENVLGTTLATVRVDPRHHLISLVSKITPSPDWILGVAGLELCLSNCTWIEFKKLNLFPWDIGTDAGPSYMAPDQPQIPPDVIRRITSSFPNDYRSPFYDETGKAMTALATLYIKRKKLYERECDIEENVRRECLTHPWMEWSECSTKCGPGIQSRERFYKNPDLAERSQCNVELNETQDCIGKQCGIENDLESGNDANQPIYGSSALCDLSEWSPWSECSASCGMGYKKRTRNYKGEHAVRCSSFRTKEALEQVQRCFGTAQCSGPIGQDDENNWNAEPGITEEDVNGPNWPTSQWNQEPDDNENNSENGESQPWNENNNYQPPSRFDDANDIIDSEREMETQLSSSRNNKPLVDATTWRYPSRFQNPGFSPPSYEEPTIDGSDSGIHEQYDEYGQKIVVVEGTDPNQYNVVQEYCLQKPYPTNHKCSGSVEISNYWFFDNDDRECKLFTTDNCDENKNKFRSMEACEGTCLKPQQNLEAQQQGVEFEGNEDAWTANFGEPQSQIRPGSSNGRRQDKLNIARKRYFNRQEAETETSRIYGENPLKQTNDLYSTQRRQPYNGRNNEQSTKVLPDRFNWRKKEEANMNARNFYNPDSQWQGQFNTPNDHYYNRYNYNQT